MKKSFKQKLRAIFTIAMVIICFSNCDKENDVNPEYSSLLKQSNEWYVTYHLNSCPGYACTYTQLYTIGNDTVINHIEYQKIIITGGEESPTESQIFGYARETKDKKVYLLENGIEKLYYDFNMNILDTIGNWQLMDIESIDILNQPRRKFKLKSICTSDTTFWVEGIGSEKGVFYRNYFDCSGDLVSYKQGTTFYELNCVFDEDIKIYGSELYDDCWICKPYEE